MKVLVKVTGENSARVQWLFDQVMAFIAFDFDVSVVFMPSAFPQIKSNKIWKALALYGVEEVFFLGSKDEIDQQALFPMTDITLESVKKLIVQADVIL